MKYILVFISSFLFIYLLYLGTVVLNKKKLKFFPKSNQSMFFVRRYKIKIDDYNAKEIANAIALANAFIIATTLIITEFFEMFLLKLFIGFIVLIPLILIIYHLVGKFYQKKEGK